VQSSRGESSSEACSHRIPVARSEMADYAQLRTMRRQHVGSETRLCAESRRPPVQENVICCARRIWQLRGENPDQDIRAFDEVCSARDHDGGPDLSLACADEDADDHVPRRQSWSSDSSASRRRREAARKSFRSSSDQASDQSIRQFGASSASRSASAESSEAASGGRRRNASTSEASRSFSCISISLHSVYGWLAPPTIFPPGRVAPISDSEMWRRTPGNRQVLGRRQLASLPRLLA